MNEVRKTDILRKIQRFENGERQRYNKLYEYYIGKQKILNTAKPTGKPNNKLVTNYAKNIVNNTTGYYLGKPITYTCDNEQLLNVIADITDYNDDAFHNMQIGKDLSVFGRAAELLYIDDDGKIRYAKINPMNLYVSYKDDIDRTIQYALRWYDTFDDETNVRTRHIEYYTDTDITYYESYNGGGISQIDEKTHYFGQVPINIYQNNEDERGDYEDAISLMDAYNVMQSESVNDYQKFADALLAVKNMLVDDKTVNDIRDKNILQLVDNGEASWLVKQVNDTYVENIKNRIDKDIYMTTSTVNMSDDNFANNASGVAIRYKLICMENRVACTERYFTKGLQRRFELICNILNLKGGYYDYTEIKITFSRNVPQDVGQWATIIQQLSGTVSNETLLAQLPFINNPKEEIERLEQESDYNINLFPSGEMNNGQKK